MFMIAEARSKASRVQNSALVSKIYLALIYSSLLIRDSNFSDSVQYLIEKMLWTLVKLKIKRENIH